MLSGLYTTTDVRSKACHATLLLPPVACLLLLQPLQSDAALLLIAAAAPDATTPPRAAALSYCSRLTVLLRPSWCCCARGDACLREAGVLPQPISQVVQVVDTDALVDLLHLFCGHLRHAHCHGMFLALSIDGYSCPGFHLIMHGSTW